MSRMAHGTLAQRIADRQPKPTSSRLIITDDEVAHFLGLAAIAIEAEGCKNPHCGHCMVTRDLWHGWYGSLHGITRIELTRQMVEAGIPTPTTPPLGN